MQKDKDIFLESVKGTQPLKRSGRQTKKIKLKNINKDSNKANQPIKIKETQFYKKDKLNTRFFSKNNPIINKRLKRGKIYIDQKVDFHGLSLIQARKKFFETINFCYRSNKRCILFITGKGMKSYDNNNAKPKLYYGKIRENFKIWIHEKEVVNKILSTSNAGPSFGGDGAFFVYLRKNSNST